MNIYVRSMIAGFAATVVLSLLMIMKASMGLMPQLNVIAMLGGMSHGAIGVGGPGIGWLMHFLIGTVLWGLLFAVLYDRLPGSGAVAKGMAFSVLAWLLMMILAMPMAGAGLFGLGLRHDGAGHDPRPAPHLGRRAGCRVQGAGLVGHGCGLTPDMRRRGQARRSVDHAPRVCLDRAA